MKVFLDTNVILDFYDSNRGHYMPTAIVFDLANVTRTCPLSCHSLSLPDLNLHIEALDFQTLLRNAKERNNPFFDHLFTAKV